MGLEPEQTGAPDNGLTWWALGIAVGLHVLLFLVLLAVGLIDTKKPEVKPKEDLVPIDMTIVPPWAKKTDDPNPDPNPPKEEKKPQPKQQPKKKTPEKKKVDVVDKNALEKVKPPPPKFTPGRLVQVPQPKPQPSPQPKPDSTAEPPKDITYVIRMNLKAGKGTAAEKPLENIDLDKMLNGGYKYGKHNNLVASEAQRCASLIKEAIDREWNKESFNWHSGLRPIKVDFQLGAGGIVRGFAIQSGSGDAEVDRTALNALKRLKDKGGIPALSKSFIEQYPRLTVTMEPTQGR